MGKKPLLVGLLLLCLAPTSVSAANLWTYDQFTDGEEVRVTVDSSDSPLATRTDSSTLIQVYVKDAAHISISKTEAAGGFAHGVSYWVNNGVKHNILWAYFGNGTASIPLNANDLLQVQVYKTVVVIDQPITPLISLQTHKDTSGPAIAPSPGPGAYGSDVTVNANASDTGSGLAVTNPVHWTLTRTGGQATSGNAGFAAISGDGVYTLRFDATDRLGNTSSWQGTYTIDSGPPTLSSVRTNAVPRADGKVDFGAHFDLTDPGAGLNLPTLQVQLSQVGGQSWLFPLSALSTAPNGSGGVTVTVPAVAVARASQVILRITVADNLQKTLSTSDADLTFQVFSASIPASGLTSGMQPPALPNRQPVYTVPIVFDLAALAFSTSHASRYVLRRTVAGGTTEVAADLDAAQFVSALSSSGGFAVYTDSMRGAAYAHKTISYTLVTTFSAGTEESTLGSATLPDILAWSVQLNVGGQVRQTYLSGAGPSATDLSSFAGAMFVLPPDPEGDPLTMQVQYLGPGGVTGTYPAAGGITQALLSDVFANGPEGIYDCTFLVSEAGSSMVQTSSTVRITMGANVGEITEDTTWSTAKTLLTPVTIHPGATLRVSADLTISDPRISITVLPGAGMVIDDGVLIQTNDWTAAGSPGVDWQYWEGIMVSGDANGSGTLQLGAATIRGALRGVAALQGSVVTIQGTRFEDCRTGVHAYGSAPVIDNAWFVGSARYGIKEDAGGNPVVTNSRFQGNTYDYYDEVLTVVDAAGINDLLPLNRNSGNSSVPVTP